MEAWLYLGGFLAQATVGQTGGLARAPASPWTATVFLLIFVICAGIFTASTAVLYYKMRGRRTEEQREQAPREQMPRQERDVSRP
jgi:hypothetical protein